MNVSEIVNQLQKNKNELGDVEVQLFVKNDSIKTGGIIAPVDSISVRTEEYKDYKRKIIAINSNGIFKGLGE